MSNETEHRVKVVFGADASPLQKALKDLQKRTKQFAKRQKGTGKENLHSQKKIQSLTDKYYKNIASATKKSISATKQMNKQLKEQTRIVKQNRKEIAGLERQLKKLRGGGGGGGGGRGGGGRGGGGGGKGSGSFFAGGVAAGVGVAAVQLVKAVVGKLTSLVTSQISSGYSNYVNYAKAGVGVRGIASRREIDKAVKRGGTLGYTGSEVMGQIRGHARQTGTVGSLATAQAYARSFSMDVGEVGGIMGGLTKAGTGFGGSAGAAGKRVLSNLFAQAVTSGLDRSRATEHLKAVQGLVSQGASETAGDVNASKIGALLTFLSRTGSSGFQGARGAAVISRLDSGVRRLSRGGPEDARAMQMRAFGWGAGGNASYYEALRAGDQGIVNAPGNLLKILSQFNTEFRGKHGGEEARNLAFRDRYGLSLPIVEQLFGAVEKGGGESGVKKALEEIMKQNQSPQEKANDILDNGFGKVTSHLQRVDSHLREMGERVAPDIMSIQTSINEMVETLFPIALRVLEVMAKALTWISDFLKASFAGLNVGFDAQYAAKSIQQDEESLRAKLASGNITKSQFLNEIGKLRVRAISESDRLANQEHGFLTKVLDGLGVVDVGDQSAAASRTLRPLIDRLGIMNQTGATSDREVAQIQRLRQEYARTYLDASEGGTTRDQYVQSRMRQERLEADDSTPGVVVIPNVYIHADESPQANPEASRHSGTADPSAQVRVDQ